MKIEDTQLGPAYGQIGQFVMATDAQRLMMSLWAAHTHAYRLFAYTPRLALTAEEPGCGKSTAMNVVTSMCVNPVRFSYVSERSIHNWLDEHPSTTLAMDEVDKVFGTTGRRESRVLHQVINDGNNPEGQVLVTRGTHAILIPVFCPVATAGIGTLPKDMLERSVEIALHKAAPDEIYMPRHKAGLRSIGDDLGNWLNTDQFSEFASGQPDMANVKGDPRTQTIMAPLSAIAEYCDVLDQFTEGWEEMTSDIKVNASKPLHELLLADILGTASADDTLIGSGTLLPRLKELPRWTYVTLDRSGERFLADLLRQSGVTSKTKDGKRGYLLDDVESAFSQTARKEQIGKQ